MRHLLFVAPNFYVVRNWLASGLAGLCRDNLDLVPVFATPFRDSEFEDGDGNRFKNYVLPTGKFGQPAGFSPVLHRLHVLRAHVYAQEVPYASTQMLRAARGRNKYHYVAQAIKSLFPRGSGRRTFIRRLADSYTPKHQTANEILRELDCAGVITGSPGFYPIDQIFMIEASRLGIPVHCVVSSWDNMTTRGPFIRRPDRLMVWNNYMRDQAERIHQYPRSQTHVVGSLQFAPYGFPVTPEEAERVYANLDLPRGTPYFLYVSAQLAPEYEVEDIQVLAQALAGSRYADIPVVVRLHPQAKLETYQPLSGLNVVFDYAPRFSDQTAGGTRFGLAAIRYMAALLSGAKVVFSSLATTAILEAAIFDRPIIQLRWMDSLPRTYPNQARLVADALRYQHLKPFDATGCRHFSDTPESLISDVDYVLAKDDEFSRRRRAAVESLVSPPLSKAPWRVIDVLKTHLRRPTSSTPWSTPPSSGPQPDGKLPERHVTVRGR